MNRQISDKIHIFDNGVKVLKKHLIPLQIERYKKNNLHEPEEEEWFMKFVSKQKSKDRITFFDVGSAIGYYAILVKQNLHNCQIICYEPLKLHRKFLRTNWTLNKLNINELIIKSEAAYSKSTYLLFEKRFYGSHIKSENSNNNRLFNIFFNMFLGARRTKVKTIVLDHEINIYGSVDLMKIDVQGSEVHVLEGCSSSPKEAIN